MVNFMFLQYIDNDKKWDEFLNYKIFSLYSYKKEKRLFKDFISNRKYKDITSKLKTGSYSFSIPEKNYINKGNSSKKRVVYKFPNDELIILKYISYAHEKGCQMTGPQDPQIQHLNVLDVKENEEKNEEKKDGIMV